MADQPQTKATILHAIQTTVGDIAQVLHREDDSRHNTTLLKLLEDCREARSSLQASMSVHAYSKKWPASNRKIKRLAMKAKQKRHDFFGALRNGVLTAKQYKWLKPHISASTKSAKSRAKDIYKECAPAAVHGLIHLLGSQSHLPPAPVRLVDHKPMYLPPKPQSRPLPSKASSIRVWEARNRDQNQAINVRFYAESPEGKSHESRSIVLPEARLCKIFPTIQAVLIRKRSTNENFDSNDIICWDAAVSLSPKPHIAYAKTFAEPKAVFMSSLASYVRDLRKGPKLCCSIRPDGYFCGVQQWLRIIEGNSIEMVDYYWTMPMDSLIDIGELLGVDEKYIKMLKEFDGPDDGYMVLFS